MPLPQLAVYRHDRGDRTLVTLAGEIDLESVPLLRAALERCSRDGVRHLHVDLTAVGFCDCSGLNAFLHASQQAALAGRSLRLHHPPALLARMLDLTGCGFLLLGLPFGQSSPPLHGTPVRPLGRHGTAGDGPEHAARPEHSVGTSGGGGPSRA
ncbi:STAS domain-containing protein [Streptomyces tendae]|uniref:STAS domain-containing protein n=1 Tax=Streptomyces tendae TaxID=1932 RepID=UPI002493BCBE|nr:STAS domain-containing protein [Streptomyces tendae]